jgi:hypothetical protein
MFNISTSPQKHQLHFPLDVTPVQGTPVLIDGTGGDLTSDAGVLLLRETEAQVGIIAALTDCLADPRHPSYISHDHQALLAQRIYQIACGYPDANDCEPLRYDPAMQLAVDHVPDRLAPLASQPTMTRLENTPSRTQLYRMAQAFVEVFLQSYAEAPEAIVLDFDDTDSAVYGQQQLALFNGYYRHRCYQPLHVYEGLSGKLLTTILRPGRRPSGQEIVAYLRRLVAQIQAVWPDTLILFRGDQHYGVPAVYEWVAAQPHCHSITGFPVHPWLREDPRVQQLVEATETHYARYGEPQTRYTSWAYQASTWSHPRKLVVKVEITGTGQPNIRAITTDCWQGHGRVLYEQVYCARGKDEQYIKDHKRYLQSKRASCHRFEANQFRLLCMSAAYVLLHALRNEVCGGTRWAQATMATLQQQVLKVGARIVRFTTRIKVQLPAAYPWLPDLVQLFRIFSHLRTESAARAGPSTA